jgi:hypothetical protein
MAITDRHNVPKRILNLKSREIKVFNIAYPVSIEIPENNLYPDILNL